jgi:predicted DNA-binding WGR domain protein
MLTTDTAAELVKRNPEANQARYYRIALWPDLFGGFSLAREYGRIGQPGLLRLDPHAQEDQARSAMHRLVRRKIRRGYKPLGGGQT